MNIMPWVNYRGIVCIRNKFKARALIIPEKSIPKKRVLYVRGKHYGLPGFRIVADLTKWIFTHVGLSARMRTIIIVQEVEVNGWLLSGSEELTMLCCSFLTLVASKRFGERLSHRLNRRFVWTDNRGVSRD